MTSQASFLSSRPTSALRESVLVSRFLEMWVQELSGACRLKGGRRGTLFFAKKMRTVYNYRSLALSLVADGGANCLGP